MLALALTFLFVAARSDAAIYWTNSGNGTIGRAADDGSNVDQSFISGLGSPSGIAVDSEHVYWTDPAAGTISRANLDGTGVQTNFITGLGNDPGLAVYDGYLYWTSRTKAAIGRATVGGAEINPEFITNLFRVQAITVDSSGIYWTQEAEVGEEEFEGRISYSDLAGGNKGTLAPVMPSVASGLAHRAEGYFWSIPAYGTIAASNPEGTSWNNGYVQEISAPGGIALDAEYPNAPDYLYYAATGGNEIGRFELGEETPEPGFITGANAPLDVAVEGGPIVRAKPTLSLTATTGVATGSGIHATAELTGGNQVAGSVEFKLYGPGDQTCSGQPVESWTETISAGAAESPEYTANQAGTYHWSADYAGDARNEAAGSTCSTTSVITQSVVQPTIDVEPSAATAIGGSIHGTALLASGNAPTGVIVFGIWGPADETCSGAPLKTYEVPVTGNGSYTSPEFTPTEAGRYRWGAFYEGDADNKSAAGGCEDAAVSVERARPTVTDTASSAVTLGDAIHDTVTLADGYAPTGTIVLAVWGPDEKRCEAAPLAEYEVKVDGNGAYTGPDFTPASAGTYTWAAIYAGDVNNEAARTSCSDASAEVVVSPRPSTTRPTVGPTPPSATSPPASMPLQLVKVKRSKTKGTGVARFSVPAAGTLTVSGKGVKTRKVTVGTAGVAKVPLIPKGSYLRRLLTNHRGFTRIKATFRPASGGPPKSQTRRVRLVRR